MNSWRGGRYLFLVRSPFIWSENCALAMTQSTHTARARSRVIVVGVSRCTWCYYVLLLVPDARPLRLVTSGFVFRRADIFGGWSRVRLEPRWKKRVVKGEESNLYVLTRGEFGGATFCLLI